MGISRYAEKFREGYSRGLEDANTDDKNIRSAYNTSLNDCLQALNALVIGALIYYRFYNWILLALLFGSLLPALISYIIPTKSPRPDIGKAKLSSHTYYIIYYVTSISKPCLLFFVFIRPLSMKGIDSGIGTTLLILAGLYSIFSIYKLITIRSLKWLHGFINPMIIFTWKFVGLDRFQMGYLFGLKGLILLTVAIVQAIRNDHNSPQLETIKRIP